MSDEALAKMSESLNEAPVVKQEMLKEDSTENVEKNLKKPEDEVHPVTAHYVKAVLNNLKGLRFKCGDCFFQVNYINDGQHRFTAELVNPIVKPK